MDSNIGFSIAEYRFVIEFAVIPQTVEFSSLPDQNLIFTEKSRYGRHIGSAISKSEFKTVFGDLKNPRVSFQANRSKKIRNLLNLSMRPPY